MKRLILLAFVICAGTPPALSQEMDIYESDKIRMGELIMSFRTTKTTGSPYLLNAWFNGKLITDSGAKSKKLILRFNTLNNTVEYRKNGKVYGLNTKKLNGFIIINKKDTNILFKNGFSSGDFNRNAFLRVIYDGSTKLLARHTSELIEDISNYGNANKINEYRKEIDYYLIKKGRLYGIELEKESILNVLSSKRKKLAEYAESNNLSFEKEKEVGKILIYYDKIK